MIGLLDPRSLRHPLNIAASFDVLAASQFVPIKTHPGSFLKFVFYVVANSPEEKSFQFVGTTVELHLADGDFVSFRLDRTLGLPPAHEIRSRLVMFWVRPF